MPKGASFERRTRAQLPTENVFALRALLGLFARAARARFFRPSRPERLLVKPRGVRRAHSLGNPIQDAYFSRPGIGTTSTSRTSIHLRGTSANIVNVPVVARMLAMGKDGNAYA